MDNFDPEAGHLILVLGNMFSGKTSYVAQKLAEIADIGYEAVYIHCENDSARDTEGSDSGVTTHNSTFKELSDKVATVSAKKLSDVNVDDYDAVGVDEFQFRGQEDVETIRKWFVNENKIVIVASLNGDYRMQSFGYTKDLICMATDIKFKKAKCKNCIQQSNPYRKMVKAPYTHRITENTEQVSVGGEDQYIPVCLKCYKDLNNIQ